MKLCKEGVGGESKERMLLKFKRANDFEPALQLNLSNYSTVYSTVTVTPLTNVTVTVTTPSTVNVIPVVIGTTSTVMILLIVYSFS